MWPKNIDMVDSLKLLKTVSFRVLTHT